MSSPFLLAQACFTSSFMLSPSIYISFLQNIETIFINMYTVKLY